MKKLKAGVIGLGMGKGHIDKFREHPMVEVVAIADLDEEKLKKIGEDKKITNLYNDPEKMIKEAGLDIVAIAVPNKFHKPLTITALEAGLHVICEKPMAMNAQEAEDMLEAAKKAGKKLQINFSFRFTPQSYAMKKQVEAGLLGDIYFCRTVWQRRRGMPGFGGWFGTKALSGGGPLIDLGVHRLDLALWLMDYPEPEWVMGSTYDHIATGLAKKAGKTFDVEDFACAMIKFKNGATLELEASWAGNIKNREMMSTRLLGTKAGLYQTNLGEGYEFEAEFYFEKDGCQYDMKLHPPVPDCQHGFYGFVESIINDTPVPAPGEHGVIVMKLLDAIYESAAKGVPIRIS
jgi:predicted dehydrogenase